jgi:hypothetical protein
MLLFLLKERVPQQEQECYNIAVFFGPSGLRKIAEISPLGYYRKPFIGWNPWTAFLFIWC